MAAITFVIAFCVTFAVVLLEYAAARRRAVNVEREHISAAQAARVAAHRRAVRIERIRRGPRWHVYEVWASTPCGAEVFVDLVETTDEPQVVAELAAQRASKAGLLVSGVSVEVLR